MEGLIDQATQMLESNQLHIRITSDDASHRFSVLAKVSDKEVYGDFYHPFSSDALSNARSLRDKLLNGDMLIFYENILRNLHHKAQLRIIIELLGVASRLSDLPWSQVFIEPDITVEVVVYLDENNRSAVYGHGTIVDDVRGSVFSGKFEDTFNYNVYSNSIVFQVSGEVFRFDDIENISSDSIEKISIGLSKLLKMSFHDMIDSGVIPRIEYSKYITNNIGLVDFKEVLINFDLIQKRTRVSAFLLQERYRMRGDLFLEHVEKRLSTYSQSRFRKLSIAVSGHNSLTYEGVIFNIAKRLGFKLRGDVQDFTYWASKTVCDLMQHGYAYLFDIQINSSATPINILNEFIFGYMNDFLIEIVKYSQENSVKMPLNSRFVTIISTNDLKDVDLPIKYPDHYCVEYNPVKMMNLRLVRWTEEDIQNWLLIHFSTVDEMKIKIISSLIYKLSGNGLPAKTASLLYSLASDKGA